MSEYPLSYAQLLLAFMDTATGGAVSHPSFTLCHGYRLTGRVDTGALAAAFSDVARRHPALRTRLQTDTGLPRQEILDVTTVPLQIRDLATATDDLETAADDFLHDVERGGQDPSRPPHLTAHLGRFRDGDAVLAVITQHVATDEWSMNVLIRDLAAFYHARCRGDAASSRLPAVLSQPQHADREQSQPMDQSLRDRLRYWRAQLAGAAVTSVFHPPTPQAPANPHLIRFHLDPPLLQRVDALAKTTRASRFMALLAAYYCQLHAVTGEPDLGILTFTPGRSTADLEQTVGFFLNPIPLRIRVDSTDSFLDVLRTTRANCLRAYTHEVPAMHLLEQVPEAFGLLADDRQVIVPFQLVQVPVFDQAGRLGPHCTYRRVRRRKSRLPTGCTVPHDGLWSLEPDGSGGLDGSILLRHGDPRSTEAVAAGYQSCLRRLTEQPDRPIARLSSLTIQ